MQRHVVLFTLHCHDAVSNYFHLVVRAMKKSIVLWNRLFRDKIIYFSCYTLGLCNTWVWGYFGEFEESSVSVSEANLLLPTFSPNARCQGQYDLISCIDTGGVLFLAEIGLELLRTQ